MKSTLCKYLRLVFLFCGMSVIALFANGCGSSQKITVHGLSAQTSGDEIAVYTFPIGDGVVLGVRITTKGEQPRYYPIKVATQPGFPITRAKVYYSSEKDAWWIQCESNQFHAESYYSIKQGRYVDQFGSMTTFGNAPEYLAPEYIDGFVPEKPSDQKVVLDIELGEKAGVL